MPQPYNPKRAALGMAKKFLLDERDPGHVLERIAGLGETPARGASSNPQRPHMQRSRKDILTNLDDMYREAFERAKESGDHAQLASLDFAYRREQLYFEILLDVRESLETR